MTHCGNSIVWVGRAPKGPASAGRAIENLLVVLSGRIRMLEAHRRQGKLQHPDTSICPIIKAVCTAIHETRRKTM
jgi:hypothetical protein